MSSIDVGHRLLSVSEVAERLGVSRRTVERKIATGEIPALQLGGKHSPIRVDAAELRDHRSLWTLLLPVALIVGVFAAGLSSWFYERVPEDIQAGIVFGASFGLLTGALALLARHWIARLRAPSAGAGR